MQEMQYVKHSRKPSIQFNSSMTQNMSERNTASEHDKIIDEQMTENALQNQFSILNNNRKKNQETYFKHKGDANLKIGSNIDFILESEPENFRTISEQLQINYNSPSPLLKTLSQQGTNENERLFLKKSDTARTDDPPTQRGNSEEFSGYPKRSETQHILRKQFNIGIKVQKFITNIMSFQALKNFYHLKQFQLSIINDPVCTNINELVSHKQKPKGQFFSRLSNKNLSQFKLNTSEDQQKISDRIISALANSTNSCFAKIGVIHPLSKFKICWQTLHLFFMLMILFILPVEAALFDTDFVKLYPYKFKGLTKGAFGFFLIDILIQLNTGVFDKGTIVTDRQELARRYIKNNLFLDFITAVTLFAKELGFPKYINIIILCKIPTFQNILNELQEANQSKSNVKFQNILKFVRLVIELLFIAHLYACVFLYIDSMEQNYGQSQTWLSVYAKNIKQDPSTFTWHYKYMQSFYLCITTMTTVGYGDITPQNQIETIFYIVTLLTLCGVFAYSFNLVGVIVQEINKKSKDFKREICLVNYYMEKLSISNELKYQVRKYLEYQHHSNEDITLAEEQYILNKLSPALKEKLILDAHMQIIKKCGGVLSQFSEEFLEKVCLNFSKQKFSKGEIIFKPHQKEQDLCFYFIDDGEVDLYYESPSIQFQHDLTVLQEDQKDQKDDKEKNILDLNTNIQVVKTLETDSYFGEICFYTNGVRTLGAICKNNARCFVIQRSKFIKLLKKCPRDYEMFCKLKDKIINDQSAQSIGTACFSCRRYGHTFQNCPLLQCRFDRERIFLLENKKYFQARNEIRKSRRRRIKFSALREIQNVQEKVELKKISMEEVDSEDYDDQSDNSSQDVKSIDQNLKVKKSRTFNKKYTRTISNNNIGGDKFNRMNSQEKFTQQKSHNFMKQSSLDNSKSVNIQTEGNEEQQQQKTQSYLPAIEENESLKESSPLRPKKQNDQTNRNEMQQVTLNKYQELPNQKRQILPEHLQSYSLQQQMMLASIQNIMLQRQSDQETANGERHSIVKPNSTHGLPEQQLNQPISPLLKPSTQIVIESPQIQRFGYRFMQQQQHELDTDPFLLFQAQLARQQQQQQQPISILHEQQPQPQQTAENQSIQKIPKNLPQYPKIQTNPYDPLTQFLIQQQENPNRLQEAFVRSPTQLETSQINYFKANKQFINKKEQDTPYVIEEHMQEFRVYYPEYNYSVVKFKFPRSSKDNLSLNTAFGKYTYFNRLVIKKNDRKKSRKQSERVVANSHQRMSLLNQ